MVVCLLGCSVSIFVSVFSVRVFCVVMRFECARDARHRLRCCVFMRFTFDWFEFDSLLLEAKLVHLYYLCTVW